MKQQACNKFPYFLFQWYSNSFISALGGALSLFLGISLSMIFEIVELIIDIVLNIGLYLYWSSPKGKALESFYNKRAKKMLESMKPKK